MSARPTQLVDTAVGSAKAAAAIHKRSFSEAEAAVYCGVSARSLRALRARDHLHIQRGEPIEGPAWRRRGGRIYYYVEDLDEYLNRAERLGTCETKRTATSGSEAQRRHVGAQRRVAD